MRKILIIAILTVFSLDAVLAQEQISKKEKRKIEKAEKKAKLKKSREAYLSLVNSANFVIEANTIIGNRLQTYQVSPNINFVKVDGDDVVIQTGSNHAFGYNGLGGITIVGKIMEYEVIEGKDNEQIQVMARISSPVTGFSTLNIYIGSDGYASARLVDNWSNRITFNGNAYALEDRINFEGQRIF